MNYTGGTENERRTRGLGPVLPELILSLSLAPLRIQGATGEVLREVLSQAHQSDALSRIIINRAKEEMKISVPTGPTIRDAGKRFIENRRVFKLRTGHTIYDYTRTLEVFEAVVGNVTVAQVTRQHIRDFRDKVCTMGRYWGRGEKIPLQSVPEENRISSKTVHKLVKNVATFFNCCVQEDLVATNPTMGIDLPTVPRNPTEPPPPELADALCTLPPLQRASVVGILEWEVMPWFYRFTGARCAEIGQLRIQDVMVHDGVLCLWVVTLKQQSRSQKNQGDLRRLVPVHPRLKPILDRVLAARAGCAPESRLFLHAGDYFCATINEIRYAHGWNNHYNDHAKKIWPKMHVHAWRSYAITEMARHGVPEEVRRTLVGHVPRDVHAGYNHVDLKRLVDAVNAIP